MKILKNELVSLRHPLCTFYPQSSPWLLFERARVILMRAKTNHFWLLPLRTPSISSGRSSRRKRLTAITGGECRGVRIRDFSALRFNFQCTDSYAPCPLLTHLYHLNESLISMGMQTLPWTNLVPITGTSLSKTSRRMGVR